MICLTTNKPATIFFVGSVHIFIDWEYPARQGAGCNEIAPSDSENFILLLQELRQALDETFTDNYKEISMAVHVDPFVGSDGAPMSDVSAYVPVVDHINLMTYGKKMINLHNYKLDCKKEKKRRAILILINGISMRIYRYQWCMGK